MDKNLLEIAAIRRATKNYNHQKIDPKNLQYIFEVTNTAPTSMGLEQWRVINLEDETIKTKLQPYTMMNKKRWMQASNALVFVTKTEAFFKNNKEALTEKMVRYSTAVAKEYNTSLDMSEVEKTVQYIQTANHGNNDYNFTEWSKRQAYIASAYTMLAATELGLGSTPMEGFDENFIQMFHQENLISKDETIALVVLLGDTTGVEHAHNGDKQLRVPTKTKFITI